MRSIELVGVLHLLDQFLAPFLGQVPVAPIVQQPVVQPVLVDGGQLVPQAAVEIFNDLCIAFHVPLLRGYPWIARSNLELL